MNWSVLTITIVLCDAGSLQAPRWMRVQRSTQVAWTQFIPRCTKCCLDLAAVPHPPRPYLVTTLAESLCHVIRKCIIDICSESYCSIVEDVIRVRTILVLPNIRQYWVV